MSGSEELPVRFDPGMNADDRERVLASLRRLAWPGLDKGMVISRLPGGASNNNYLLVGRQTSAVLRVAAPDAARFGIDRSSGLATHRQVAADAITPTLLGSHLPSGDCLTLFLDGFTIDAESVRQPELLSSCIDLLRKTHGLAVTPGAGIGSFSASRDIDSYVTLARSEGLSLPPDIDDMVEVSRHLDPERMPFGPRLTHNDVQLANFLVDTAGRTWLLDWEYAGTGNIYFDLAMLASNADMSEEEGEVLLRDYFASAGPVRPCDRSRLRAMVVLSALREAMWSVVAGPVMSDTGWDYQAWAERFFTKVRGELALRGIDELAEHAEHTADDDRVASLIYSAPS